MKNKFLPIILILGLLISCSDKPSFPHTGLSPNDWKLIEQNGDLSIWSYHDTEYAVVFKNKIISSFMNDHHSVNVVDAENNEIRTSVENKLYKNMRLHDFYKGQNHYTLIDHNGDGFIDAKRDGNKFWIYKNGKLIEVLSDFQKDEIKNLENGKKVIFKNGKWEEI